MSVTQIDPSPAQTSTRKIRCRVLTQPYRNPCSNQALDEAGVCLHHLEEIGEHWAHVMATAAELLPVADSILRKHGITR